MKYRPNLRKVVYYVSITEMISFRLSSRNSKFFDRLVFWKSKDARTAQISFLNLYQGTSIFRVIFLGKTMYTYILVLLIGMGWVGWEVKAMITEGSERSHPLYLLNMSPFRPVYLFHQIKQRYVFKLWTFYSGKSVPKTYYFNSKFLKVKAYFIHDSSCSYI